jgi:predicted metal-dependent phosphoesterase TrpH
MGEIDLHVHTTASDGTLTPSETVQLAKSRGVKAIAITDHDTVDGVEEAVEEGRRLSVEVIPGVEISANLKAGNLHLLGYFVDTGRGILTEKLERLKRARSERNPRIIGRLNDLGVDITHDEIVQASGGGQIGRPHFAQVLVAKGYVASIDEAFRRYLARGAPAYVQKYRFKAKEAIDVILRAGGIPVLAHPYTLNGTKKELERVLTELVHDGLRGIEAFYPDHNRDQIAQYHRAATQLGLIKTGGSDFHGTLVEKGQLGEVGNGIQLPYKTVEELMQVKHEMTLTS